MLVLKVAVKVKIMNSMQKQVKELGAMASTSPSETCVSELRACAESVAERFFVQDLVELGGLVAWALAL